MKSATIILSAMLALSGSGLAVTNWTVTGSEQMDLVVLAGERPLFRLENVINGWGWKRGKPSGTKPVVENGRRVLRHQLSFYENPWFGDKALPGQIGLEYSVEQTGPQTIRLRYACTPDIAMQFGMPKTVQEPVMNLGPILPPSAFLEGSTMTVTTADGKTETMPLPPPRGATARVVAATLKTKSGETMKFTFDPPLFQHRDYNEARFWAESAGTVAAGQTYTQTITMELPVPVTFEPANRWVDTSHWFPITTTTNDFVTPSVIGCQDWIERPAGKRGFVQSRGDRFVFADGMPVKFWGVHVNDFAITREKFDRWAESLPMYGCNLTRWMMFAKPNDGKWTQLIAIQDKDDGLKFDREKLDLFDYGFAKLKAAGVYTAFSPFWGWKPTVADKNRLLNWDDAQKLIRTTMPMEGSFYAATSVMPDVIDVQIQFHVNLLNHVNPYTGLRYADDPALAWVEFWNEEDLFMGMFSYEGLLAKAPAYKKLNYQRFADWLKSKYGTRDALAKAWGTELAATENVADANITPFPKYFSGNTNSPRIVDQMQFLYTVQRDLYKKFADAVRATGYQGAIDGGCWQAPNWLGHLNNVRNDWETGFIDRHNYAQDDLAKPGAGTMCGALQAVIDRPFSYSEWSGGYRVGTACDIPIVAAYCMGLQGWDASMHFAWKNAGILHYQANHCSEISDNFNTRGQFPALARLVYRGDVRQGDVAAVRRISLPGLAQGDVDFEETFSLLGGANNKIFRGAMPQEALAVGRVGLEFVDGPVTQPVTDNSAPFIERNQHLVRANTGQLAWDTSGAGFIVINTPGTQGVVGHAAGGEHRLSDVRIQTGNPYVQIYVTALGPKETIAIAKNLLITTMGRTVNQGTVFDELATRPVSAPVAKEGKLLIEPVKATFELKGNRPARVFALDQNGRKPANAQPLLVEQTKDGLRFTVDGAQTKTVYYLVEQD